MKRCGREPVLFRVGVHIFDHNGDTPEASKRLSLTLVISSDWLRNDEKHAHEHRGGSQDRATPPACRTAGTRHAPKVGAVPAVVKRMNAASREIDLPLADPNTFA